MTTSVTESISNSKDNCSDSQCVNIAKYDDMDENESLTPSDGYSLEDKKELKNSTVYDGSNAKFFKCNDGGVCNDTLSVDESDVGIDIEEEDDENTGSLGRSSSKTLGQVREAIYLVGIVRSIMVLTILTFAFVAAESVFLITINHEEARFKASYDVVSDKLIEAFYDRIDNMLWVAKTFATEITTSRTTPIVTAEGAATVSSSFPFVTLQDFNKRCVGPLHLTKASLISFSPIVSLSDIMSWEEYAVDAYNLSKMFSESNGKADRNVSYYDTKRNIRDGVYLFENKTAASVLNPKLPYIAPIWQIHPTPDDIESNESLVANLFDETSQIVRANALQEIIQQNITEYLTSTLSGFLFEDTNGTDLAYYDIPRTNLYTSITDRDKSVVGIINFQFQWENSVFENVLDDTYNRELLIVLENQCSQGSRFSYNVTGRTALYAGVGDLHDHKVKLYSKIRTSSYDEFGKMFQYQQGDRNFVNGTTMACPYKISIYPSEEFKGMSVTHRPLVYRGIVLLAVFLGLIMFFIFDCAIRSQATSLAQVAKDSDAIVRSLFPGDFADRIYHKQQLDKKKGNTGAQGMSFIPSQNINGKNAFVKTQKSLLSNLLRSPSPDPANSLDRSFKNNNDEPLADLYPAVTVIFADMAGFTSWSSERDPSQVFTLLERTYSTIDKAAKKFGVFKVETIGDCYVAATGIPEAREDHAIIMCNFARSCLLRTNNLFQSLVSEFGPGTDFLLFRYGIHSGSVTAGVLRGQKCRFQLFGDTINTASRMESTGVKGRIQLSHATAELLVVAGKESWISPREDKIEAKGKGLMQTYWLHAGRTSSAGSSCKGSKSYEKLERFYSDIWNGTVLEGILGKSQITPSLVRLIDWNTDVLLKRLQVIKTHQSTMDGQNVEMIEYEIEKQILLGNGRIPNNEVKMSITIPEFDEKKNTQSRKKWVGRQKTVIETELRNFVTAVATGYHKHPFHNFEHASHVVLAATNLLKRIMAADEHIASSEGKLTPKDLYDHTFGIANDPLSQFAIVFSCLCHDLNHPGVTNAQLMQEAPHLAGKYEFRSVAEQNAVDITFELLLLPQFTNLRRAIYETENECRRFRQLCVNLILATDLMDPDLKRMRDERWNLCFNGNDVETVIDEAEIRNRKAAIVMEHIMQASDVAHTFQHWAVFTKWNECLFQELYLAYVDGRSDKDPSINWYEGEISFFDYYIIPLASKMKDCWSVFGICHSEFLNYATSNRMEWQMKGTDETARMKLNAIERAEKRAKLNGVSLNNYSESCDTYEERDNSNQVCLTTASSNIINSREAHWDAGQESTACSVNFEVGYTQSAYFDVCTPSKENGTNHVEW